MRVIAGSAKGRRLRAPRGRAVRPTSDRVREALFSSLGDRIPGASVLDLFAGSGALGIEALSRGAGRAVLVERDPRAVAVIDENLERTGLAGRAQVVRDDAARFCQAPGTAFDVVFADPPYLLQTAAVYALLGDLVAAGGLVRDGAVVVERSRLDPTSRAVVPLGLVLARTATYGDTVLHYLATEL
ncbi:MAG: 16S rRNA (guanine(966)-N(2))-methyltransferase RsmD [Egibacteraceae bacterium]